ncbi:hypothetical protein DUI87_01891 [Hirundo rustica rustica]|uniref:Zinc finger RNA-binding protein n=1 Tax=Hirundo rustica rustica TaxID=333673 RepID=A0A3M0L6S0_HIRRU|nr:hypothetical protein DUI87_01891 [Hirundo rustica rustica]
MKLIRVSPECCDKCLSKCLEFRLKIEGYAIRGYDIDFNITQVCTEYHKNQTKITPPVPRKAVITKMPAIPEVEEQITPVVTKIGPYAIKKTGVQKLIVNPKWSLKTSRNGSSGCTQAQLWMQSVAAAVIREGGEGIFPAEIRKIVWDNASDMEREFQSWWVLVNFTYNLVTSVTLQEAALRKLDSLERKSGVDQQPASGVAYSHPTTVASYTVHQAPVAAHTVTAAYAPAAATVAVARSAPVAVAAAATAAAYGGYPTAHTATDYGYTQRQQEAPPPPPPVTTQNYQDSYSYVRSTAPAVAYDSKQYYQQPTATAAAVAAAAQPQPSVAESYYQTGTSYSGYEAAVYSAASSYYQQQQQKQAVAAAAAAATAAWTGTTFTKKAPFQNKQLKPKQPPKPPQIHYCDVCKISCAGPQTYKEHLEGQKHKKKEAALKASQNTNNSGTSARGTQNQLRCELCDVSCTGADAYAAHIRGAKHQKVVKLHTKLGKPIPSTEPNVVTQAATSTSTSASKPTASASNIATSSSTVNSSVASSAVKILTPTANAPLNTVSNSKTSSTAANIAVKKISPPKINFVGKYRSGNKLQTTGSKLEEMKSAESVKATTAATIQTQEVKPDTAAGPVTPTTLAVLQSDVQPVGHDYVEEVRNDEGKVIRFHCKLCECSFNDPNAKEMHLKGRRHRLQYKKKVNPDLQVEVKPSIRARKIQEEKMRKQMQKEEYWRRREEEERWRMEMRRYEEDMYWRRMEEEQHHWDDRRRIPDGGYPHGPPGPLGLLGVRPGMPPQPQGPAPLRRPDSSDDRYVMTKHAAIYPTEEELQAVQKIVSITERALKLVSDNMSDHEKSKSKEGDDKKDSSKDSLSSSQISVELTVLHFIAQVISPEKYDIKCAVPEAAIILNSCVEPKMQVTITLTSPVIREENMRDGGWEVVKDVTSVYSA